MDFTTIRVLKTDAKKMRELKASKYEPDYLIFGKLVESRSSSIKKHNK